MLIQMHVILNRGVPLGNLDIIRLTFEELEAIRLKDLVDLEQLRLVKKWEFHSQRFIRS